MGASSAVAAIACRKNESEIYLFCWRFAKPGVYAHFPCQTANGGCEKKFIQQCVHSGGNIGNTMHPSASTGYSFVLLTGMWRTTPGELGALQAIVR